MGILKIRKNGKAAAAPEVPAQPEVKQPTEADLDAVAAEQKAKEATAGPAEPSPLSTPSATPEIPEQPADPGFAPDSAMGAASFLTPAENVDWTDPKLDTTKKDSLGNEKLDTSPLGPRGESKPADVMTDAERQAQVDAKEARLRKGMADTSKVDSIGHAKGRFAVTPQGHDRHGARIPDVVDRTELVEAHIPPGPRGPGAPKDSFHGAKPVKK